MKRCTVPTVSLAVAALAFAVCLAPLTSWADPKPQPNPCSGLSGAAFGLCNAYCRAVDCPAGQPGNACSSLRKNWQKVTGLSLFPCDAVCCQCGDGGRFCASAQRCLAASGCSIVDRCVDGQCGGQPTPTPTPAEPTATPTPACVCGEACKTAAGENGTCAEIAGSTECECRPNPPRPCGPDPLTHQCGGTCEHPGDTCTACNATDCQEPCICAPEASTPTPTPATEPTRTPACPCNLPCMINGQTGTCLTVAGSDECQCVPNPIPIP